MYLLIKTHYDGDEYQTFADIKEAKEEFKAVKDEGYWEHLVLCKIGPDQKFGFGFAHYFDKGDVELIEEYGEGLD